MSQHEFDIIIVGAGLVGVTQALALADTGLSIAILDRQTSAPIYNTERYDLRVFAISPASQQLFERLTVWHDIATLRVSQFRHMHVWDSEGNGSITFHANQLHLSQLGHIIENSVLLTALLQQIALHDNIQCIWPCALQQLQQDTDAVSVTTQSGECYRAKLLIAADGGNSWVREQAQFAMHQWDYQHHAIVATIQSALAHEKTAYQRFMPQGPLAVLPLADPHSCSIVWSTASDHATTLMALSDSEFNAAMTQAFDFRLSELTLMSQRMMLPLMMRHAKQYTKSRIALIGDAAHTIHPLAGQGANLGLEDAVILSQVIKEALHKSRDFAAHHTLRRYERQRKGANWQMVLGMEGLKRFFAATSPWMTSLRNNGLNLIDHAQPIKQLIMTRAAGSYTSS